MSNGKYKLIFSLDYEIHGNGDGSPYELMVEPTYRLMNLLEKYGQKLTIMADVAEILKFGEYYKNTGEDRFSYNSIKQQLCNAIQRGHDVQLHIHSSYFKSTYTGYKWEQNWEEYNMAALPERRVNEMITMSKTFLEELLKPVDKNYSCFVFRAANWSMMPTHNIYSSLVNNGIKIDTSVYKGGIQRGNVNYDYSTAKSCIMPYSASIEDINKEDFNGELKEFPIYTEMRYFYSFISFMRIFRMLRAKFHRHSKSHASVAIRNQKDPKRLSIRSFFVKSPWKLDFNQATGLQLKNALRRIRNSFQIKEDNIPVVLIGHSKTFIRHNEKTLENFLEWLVTQDEFKSGKYADFL